MRRRDDRLIRRTLIHRSDYMREIIDVIDLSHDPRMRLRRVVLVAHLVVPRPSIRRVIRPKDDPVFDREDSADVRKTSRGISPRRIRIPPIVGVVDTPVRTSVTCGDPHAIPVLIVPDRVDVRCIGIVAGMCKYDAPGAASVQRNVRALDRKTLGLVTVDRGENNRSFDPEPPAIVEITAAIPVKAGMAGNSSVLRM